MRVGPIGKVPIDGNGPSRLGAKIADVLSADLTFHDGHLFRFFEKRPGSVQVLKWLVCRSGS